MTFGDYVLVVVLWAAVGALGHTAVTRPEDAALVVTLAVVLSVFVAAIPADED